MNDAIRKDLNTLLAALEGDACCLYLRSGHGSIFELIEGIGVTQRFMDLCRYVRVGHGFVGKIAESGKERIAENTEADMTYLRKVTAEEGYKSAMGIPLLDSGQTIGVLYLLWNERRSFSEPYILEAKKNAEKLIEEVRQLHVATETRRRARALRVLYKLGGDIYSLMDLKRIGEAVSEEIKEFLDIQTFLICLQGDYREQCVICEGEWVGNEALIMSMSEGQEDPSQILTLEIKKKRSKKLRSVQFMTIPVTLGNQNLGRIVIGFCDRLGLEPWEIEFLQQMGRMVAVAIANYDMFISHQIRTTFLERSRLSQEFHDSLAQILASIMLEVNVAKEVAEREGSDQIGRKLETVSEMLIRAYEEVRAIIQDLGIHHLRNISGDQERSEPRSFLELLNVYLSNFASRTGIEVCSKLPRAEVELPMDIEVQLWRIIQEALNNVWKHACATKVDIKISLGKNNLKVVIADNGCGITPQWPLIINDGKHFGLFVMNDRARSVGGEFTIDTAPGAGTCIKASFPLASFSRTTSK